MTARRVLVAVAILVAFVVLAVLLLVGEGDGPDDCGDWFSLDASTAVSTEGLPRTPAGVLLVSALNRKPPAPARTKKPTPTKPVKPRKHDDVC